MTPTEKTTNKNSKLVDASAWDTIHVFGFGESQIINTEINLKAPNSELQTLSPLIEFLASIQQEGTNVSLIDLHSLNIFKNSFIDFLPISRDNKRQRFMWETINEVLITDLSEDIINNAVAPPQLSEPIFDIMAKYKTK